MNTTSLAADKQTASPLLWGSNLGLGEPLELCSFKVEVNGVFERWTIEKTLARIRDFSEAAQTRIKWECGFQMQHY